MFEGVIKSLRNSSQYQIEEYQAEIEKTVAILSQTSPSQLVSKLGELHFQINKTIARTNARSEFYKTLQKTCNYEFTLKSKQLQKTSKLIGKYLDLWYIGRPFSSRNGNFIIYYGEVYPFELLNVLDYPNNLIPHTWRDVKSYREKGIIDIETGEGIVGTEIGDECLLIQKPWFYQLYDKKGFLELVTLCGTTGQYNLTIRLNDDEIKTMHLRGIIAIDDLADNIRSNPDEFKDRSVNLNTDIN